MNLFKEQVRHYLIFSELKSEIKIEEKKKQNFESEVEKYQREVLELCTRLDKVQWKLKRAEFILSCEKRRHDFFYEIIKAAEDDITQKDPFFRPNELDLNEYRLNLQKEKQTLLRILAELQN